MPTFPGGITLERAKARLGTGGTPATDADLQEVLLGVIGFFAGQYGRTLFPNPAEDSDPDVTITSRRVCGRRWIRIPDARVVSGVTVDGVAIDSTGWDLSQQNGVGVHVILDCPAMSTVAITGRFGFTTLPDELIDAIYAHAARNYREKDAAFADQVGLADGAIASYFRTMSPRVKAVYDLYTVASDLVGLA